MDGDLVDNNNNNINNNNIDNDESTNLENDPLDEALNLSVVQQNSKPSTSSLPSVASSSMTSISSSIPSKPDSSDTAELRSFREQWKKEVTQKPSSSINTEKSNELGMDLYSQGAMAERKGDYTKAIKLYKQAFKVNPALEKKMAPTFAAKEKETNKTEPPTDLLASLNVADDNEATLLHQFTDIPDHCIPKAPSSLLHISVLPTELIVLIFSQSDPKSLELCSRVCKTWYRLAREPYLWRKLCINLCGFSKTLLNKITQQGWRRTFIEWPRIRCNGIYISKNVYIRPGLTEGIYHQPIHQVFYFRYFRFFDNGKCIAAMSFSKPKDVVPHLQLNNHTYLSQSSSINYQLGTYKLNEENNNVEVEVINHQQKCHYHWVLELGSFKSEANKKLTVIEYKSIKSEAPRGSAFVCFPVHTISKYFFTVVPDHLLNPPTQQYISV